MAALGPPTWDADAWSTDAWAADTWQTDGAPAALIPDLAAILLRHRNNAAVRQLLSFLRGV